MGYDLQSRLRTVSLGGVSATYQYQAGGTTLTGVNRPLSAVVGAPAGVMVIEGSLSRDAVGRVRFFGVASALGSLSPTNDDGNLTFDGRCHYEWDGESSRGTEARWTDDKVGCPEGVRARAERPNQNRLIGMEEAASHSIFGTGVSSGFARANRLEFAYDALGRRVRKRVLDAPRDAQGVRSGAWVLKKETVFVWQDWRMLAEYVKTPEITTLQLRRSYLWGMDLVSGVYEAGMAENATALSPAGGVGGLLWVVDYLPGQSTSNRQLAPWYDGNGNILGWVENELAQVQPLHRLEYDAFGRLLVDDPVRVALTKKQSDLGATEAWLDRPAFGFSTKYEDGETGLLYYGYRYYAPEVGRWVNRDPIEEQGGINLYGMVGNDGVNKRDYLGLFNEADIFNKIFGPFRQVPRIIDDLTPFHSGRHKLLMRSFPMTKKIEKWADDIYTGMKSFRHFSPPNNSVVQVAGDVASFRANFPLGALPALDPVIDVWSKVRLTYIPGKRQLTGVTLPGHLLRGTRHWRVSILDDNQREIGKGAIGCNILIETWATEESVHLGVELMRHLPVLKSMQEDVWTHYFQNIGTNYKKHGVIVEKVRIQR